MSSDANELTEIMGSKGSKHKEKSHGEDDNPEDMCLVKEEVIEDDAKITEHMLKVNPSTEANDLNGDVINTEISNNTAADAKIAEHKNNKKEDDIPERDKNEQKSDDKPESTDTEKTSQSDASKTVDDSGTAEKKTDDSINEPPIVPSDDNKKDEEENPQDKTNNYYRAEFNAMDKNRDGRITTSALFQLLRLLGFAGEAKDYDNVLLRINKDEDGMVTFDEFLLAILSDPNINAQTSGFRQLFAMFDTDNSGSATKSELIDGLRDLGIKINPTIQKKIEDMDHNKDGKVTYEDFLRIQFES